MATKKRTKTSSPTANTEVIRTQRLAKRPAGAYGVDDTPSFALTRLPEAASAAYLRRAKVSAATIKLVQAQAKVRGPLDLAAITAQHPRARPELRRLFATTYSADETPLHIVDVKPVAGYVLSNRPFSLEVRYQNDSDEAVEVAVVAVLWAGTPFFNEVALARKGRNDGRVVVEFDREQSLPVGQAEFRVMLYRADGAQASFRRTVFVLPSNPLSLSVSPAGATVTGSWSARGDYHPENDAFLTEVQVTLANGDGAAVSMNRRVDWEFWDGPVGSGTRIESGSFNLSGGVSVPAHGTFGFGAWFSSPRGSGIYNVYNRKEDMAVQISMTASDGRVIRGQITCRVMLAYGVNIIKVGDLGAAEHVDLYAAVDRMRQIYERRDITLRGVQRYIINNTLAGGETVLDSETEYRDMLERWSVPNDFVDVFVVQRFNWGGYNGYAGDIPGPTTKTGREDGVAVDKTGYTDASGTLHLSVETLAQLIGHEVGHYLGLAHLEDTDNLMRSNTGDRGPGLNYDQYRTMFGHGFMVYL